MASVISTSAWRLFAGLAAWLLSALAIGLILGHPSIALALALALYVCITLWRLLRVDRWLQHRRREPPPDYDGMWGDIVAVASGLDRRRRFHKQRVIELLREFRRLTSAMPDGAVLLNADNEIIWFNERAARWLRLRRKRDFGVRVENLIRYPEFIEYEQRVQRGDSHGETPIVPIPGDENRWISLHLVQTRDAPQRLLIVREVTQQVLLETMRKEFVANASHELRSPLTVISGYLDTLDEAQFDESWREPVREMRRQAERMRAIIDDLLELSRLEGSRELAGDDPVDVAGLLSTLRKDVLSRPIHPTLTLAIESDAMLLGAENELSSVFGNLVSNAVNYTSRNGTVQIRWWTDEAGGHVSVMDTGIGIAPEHIPRLTERFYRVDTGRSRELGGSGLGLAIAKHALQRHEASLEIHSELGRGSTFICHFPAKRVAERFPEP